MRKSTSYLAYQLRSSQKVLIYIFLKNKGAVFVSSLHLLACILKARIVNDTGYYYYLSRPRAM